MFKLTSKFIGCFIFFATDLQRVVYAYYFASHKHFYYFVDNTIYCIGGIGGKGGTYERRLETVECLELGDEGGKRWRPLASMSTPRSSHTCEVMDGLIYVVGGGDGKDWLSSAEVTQRHC